MSKEPNITQLKDLLQHNSAQQLVQNVAASSPAVDDWLARLILLGDIPFQNLIGDTRLLPQNSLRFFYIDPTWLYALIDGALSIGNSTSLDVVFTGILADTIRDKASVTAEKMRAKLLKLDKYLPEGIGQKQHKLTSGLLLRSSLVQAFPALKIVPVYAPDEIVNPVPLRYEAIGDDLLLVIFPAVPVSIKIQQPPQGLQFGPSEKPGTKFYQAWLRHIAGDKTGQQIKDGDNFVSADLGNDAKLFRAGGNHVLNIAELKTTIKDALKNAGALPAEHDTISSSEFVMQLLNTPYEAEYINPTKTV